ncbi:hypothetical protein HZS_4833, partial [Henneguya salminicola]
FDTQKNSFQITSHPSIARSTITNVFGFVSAKKKLIEDIPTSGENVPTKYHRIWESKETILCKVI